MDEPVVLPPNIFNSKTNAQFAEEQLELLKNGKSTLTFKERSGVGEMFHRFSPKFMRKGALERHVSHKTALA
jgi:hypothetical protein